MSSDLQCWSATLKKKMEAGKPAEVASSPAPSNLPISPPSRLPRRKEPLIVIVVGGLWIPPAALALAWMVLRHSPRPGSENATEGPFCCPREAAQLFAVIDRSVSPCSDFFAYVCKNAIAQGYVHKGVAKDILNTISANIIRGTEYYGSSPAATLHLLYTSCLRELWQPELRARDTTEAVLAIGSTRSPMSPVDMLSFVLNAQLRYQLKFFFIFVYNPGPHIILERTHIPINQFVLQCGDVCSRITLSLVNAHLQTNYTIAQIIDWEADFLGEDFSPNPSLATFEELGVAFGGLNTSLLKAVLRKTAIYYDNKEILVHSNSFLSIVQRVWNTSSQPLSLCDMLMDVTLNAIVGLQAGSFLNGPTTETWTICNAHAYNYEELWPTTYVAALTNPAKNAQLRTVFEATRRTLVNYEPLRHIMAAGNNTEEFENFVGNLSLLLPVDLIIHDVAVPNLPAQGFYRNHFQAMSFEFEVKAAKWWRGMPVIRDDLEERARDNLLFVNETTIYVPAPAFGLLSGTTTNPLLTDAPFIASRTAALIINEVAKRRTWSTEKLKAISFYSNCMRKSTPDRNARISRDVLISRMGLHIAAAAVGPLSTFLSEAPVTADWLDLKPVWSLHRMSKAQFFYGRYAYFRCSADNESRPMVNEPLRLSPDFGLAFHCPVDKNAASSIGCANITQG